MATDQARTRSIGLLGSVVQLALAALLGGIASRPDSFPNPPEPIPRGLALGVLYVLPAVVGALGAIGARCWRRPPSCRPSDRSLPSPA